MTAPTTLIDLAQLLGALPEGDAPAAWWVSTHDEVLSAYADYQANKRRWNELYLELLAEGDLPRTTTYVTASVNTLAGLTPPPERKTTPRWFRTTPAGLLVPRRRTRAEKTGPVVELWDGLEDIPTPVLPGMPNGLVTPTAVYPVALRARGVPPHAVCAFVGVDPEQADPPFEVSSHWSAMKLSTFHALRERQDAAKALR